MGLGVLFTLELETIDGRRASFDHDAGEALSCEVQEVVSEYLDRSRVAGAGAASGTCVEHAV